MAVVTPTTDGLRVFNLRDYSHEDIQNAAALSSQSCRAAEYIKQNMEGVVEKAFLRARSEAYPFTLKVKGYPHEDAYSRAWRTLMKPGLAAPDAAPVPKVKVAAPPTTARERIHEKMYVPLGGDQERFHNVLANFLGREVDLPLLAPGVPPLDLKKLFLEVMALGGCARVSKIECWSYLASKLLLDDSLADMVAQVYAYYLAPVERLWPAEVRPARVAEWLDKEARARKEALAGIAASATCVTAACDRCSTALTALEQRLPWRPVPAPVIDLTATTTTTITSSAADACLPSCSQRGAASARLALALVKQVARNPWCDVGELQLGPRRVADACAAATSGGGGGRTGVTCDEAPAAPPCSSTDSDSLALQPGAPLTRINWEQAAPLRLLVTSLRDLGAGPPGCGLQAPPFKAHFTARLAARNTAPPHTNTGAANGSTEAAAAAGDGVDVVARGRQVRALPAALDPEGRPSSSSAPTKPRTAPSAVTGRPLAAAGPAQGSAGGGAVKMRKRAYYAPTPKCGVCHTCLHPAMKKACVTNRARLAQGLPPVFVAAAPKLDKMQ